MIDAKWQEYLRHLRETGVEFPEDHMRAAWYAGVIAGLKIAWEGIERSLIEAGKDIDRELGLFRAEVEARD